MFMFQDYLPTVFENYNTSLTVRDKTYAVMLWDTGGQEAFDRLRLLNYQNADVIAVCYDVGRYSSFENVLMHWIPEVNSCCPNIPVVLVACKTDLRTEADDQSNINNSNEIEIASQSNTIISLAEVRFL